MYYRGHPQSSNSRNQRSRPSELPPLPSPISPAVTRLVYPSPVDTVPPPGGRHHSMLNENDPRVSAYDDCYSVEAPSSYDTIEPVSPTDYESLDQLWDTLRQQKEARMAKEPPKVKSFEVYSTNHSSQRERAEPFHGKRPQNKQQLSSVAFRESSDGRSMMAYFNLPGLTKHDVHVSFHRSRLVVSWDESQGMMGQGDRGGAVHDRKEKTFSKTMPLPEGTKFEDIRAAMDGDCLILRYPNINARPGNDPSRN